MDRTTFVIGSFVFFLLVTLVGFVNNLLYLFLLKRFNRLLRERWPEKWADLGEPQLFSFWPTSLSVSRLTSLPGANMALVRFILNPGVIEDAEILSALKRVRVFLICGVVAFAVMVMSILFLLFSVVRAMR